MHTTPAIVGIAEAIATGHFPREDALPSILASPLLRIKNHGVASTTASSAQGMEEDKTAAKDSEVRRLNCLESRRAKEVFAVTRTAPKNRVPVLGKPIRDLEAASRAPRPHRGRIHVVPPLERSRGGGGGSGGDGGTAHHRGGRTLQLPVRGQLGGFRIAANHRVESVGSRRHRGGQRALEEVPLPLCVGVASSWLILIHSHLCSSAISRPLMSTLEESRRSPSQAAKAPSTASPPTSTAAPLYSSEEVQAILAQNEELKASLLQMRKRNAQVLHP